MGLLERENAAILNESLKPLCRRTIRAFRRALSELDLRCPFFMTQNDGTIIRSGKRFIHKICDLSGGKRARAPALSGSTSILKVGQTMSNSSILFCLGGGGGMVTKEREKKKFFMSDLTASNNKQNSHCDWRSKWREGAFPHMPPSPGTATGALTLELHT